MIAGYAFDRSLADLSYAAGLIGRAGEAGMDTLITKANAITPALSKLCRDAGLTILGSVTCFSDHADPLRRSDLRPADEHGRWAPMEWYTGLIPTDQSYVEALAAKCATFAGNGGLDGLVLDFLRWPLHWELELRPGATPRHTSFDPVTLAAFARDTGVAATDPRMLLGEFKQMWLTWRESIITAVAARLTAAARLARPDAAIFMFLVPGEPSQRRIVGQDVTALSAHVDGFLPMTYHGIVRQPPQWIATITSDIARYTDRSVVPMVQTTADPAVARGADWGGSLDAGAFEQALAQVDGPVCVFPVEGMDDPRWRAFAATVARRSL